MPPGCLSLLLLAGFIVLLPLFFANVMLVALGKLGLSPNTSVLAAIGIFFGGMVNVPVKRTPRDELVAVAPVDLFGFGRVFPRWVRRRTYAVIAVNLGGCVIPCLLAGYQLLRLAAAGVFPLLAALVATAINVAICYRLARPVPNVGIALPPLAPALAAAVCGITFARRLAPSIAFAAGVLGPLLGADLLHLREVERTNAGVASIGGAGTFDGIVLSGLVATLLA